MVTRTMEAAQVDVQADEYGKGARRVKVGDRVKSLVTEMDVVAGKEYVVSGACGNCVIITDDAGEAYPLDTGEWAVSDEPRFKVGDRVRVLSDYLPWARAGEIGTVQKVDACDCDCFVKFETERMGDHTWYVRWDNLELAPALTIETGQFYRTRDGRKVGPMVLMGGAALCAGKRWWCDGRANSTMETSADLIAEWVDEPQVAPQEAASNDNDNVSSAFDDLMGVVADATKSWIEDTKDPTPPTVTKARLVKSRRGYGYELARFGKWSFVDIGHSQPIVVTTSTLGAA